MANTNIFPGDRMMQYYNIPIDFIKDTNVELGNLAVPDARIIPFSIIIDSGNVKGTLSTSATAIVDNGITGQNITASTTFTGAATNTYKLLALATNPVVLTGNTEDNFLRLHITQNAVGAAISSVARLDNVATITSAAPHGLAPGDYIWVSGATNTAFNGRITVITIPTTTTFTYSNVGPDLDTTADATGFFGAHDANAQVGVFYIPGF